MAASTRYGSLSSMRILVALSGNALLRHGAAAEAGAPQPNVEVAVEALAEIAAEHELVIAHDSGPGVGAMLELGLRNALPGRDVITVVPQVVVGGDDPSPQPYAIAQLRSLRLLVDSGGLVICPSGGGIPIAVDRVGTLRGIEETVDWDLSVSLLARRLDADMLVMLADGDGPVDSQEEAVRRFSEATARPAEIGALTDAVEIVRGAVGTRLAPRDA